MATNNIISEKILTYLNNVLKLELILNLSITGQIILSWPFRLIYLHCFQNLVFALKFSEYYQKLPANILIMKNDWHWWL